MPDTTPETNRFLTQDGTTGSQGSAPAETNRFLAASSNAATTPTTPPPPPTPARFGPQAKAALQAAPPSNGLSLSDVGPMLHQVTSGVTPLADLYSAAMDAGPSSWLGFTHIRGNTFGERLRNQLAASQQAEADFAAKHPLASTIAKTGGMVAGDVARTALGPLAPWEAGAEAGLSVAPHKSLGGDLTYTAVGAPLGQLATTATRKLIAEPLSALGSRIMRYINPEDPAETYVKYATAPPPDPDAPPVPAPSPSPKGVVWPLVKTAVRATPAAIGYMHGGALEGVVGGALHHVADPLLEHLDTVFERRAAAAAAERAAAAAAGPRVPEPDEWARYWARPAPRVTPPPPSFPRGRQVLPLMGAQTITPPAAHTLANILAQHWPLNTLQDKGAY